MEDNKRDMSENQEDNLYEEHFPVKKKRRGIFIAIKILICFISVISISLGGLSIYAANYVFSNLTTNPITKDKEELGITEGTVSVESITNIAIFGVDSLGNSFSGRSDTIMILTIDEIHKKVKITSILRDSRVYMGEDYYTYSGWDKINHAYNYGPEFALKVLNTNFGLDIQDYVTVNFNSVESIVDAMGGVEVEITSDEAYFINIMLKNSDYVPYNGGLVHLNGEQALCYSRNRTLGGDQERVRRQYDIIEALANKVLEMSATDYPGVINELSEYVELSLDVTEILSFTPFVVGGFEMESIHVPDYEFENPDQGLYENDLSMWSYDLEAAAQRINEFIYEGEEGTRLVYTEGATDE